MSLIAEAIMAGLSVTGGSNTSSPVVFAREKQPCVVNTYIESVRDHEIRPVATLFSRTMYDNTKTTSVFWDFSILGDNYLKLLAFCGLQKGWDGYEADSIPESVIYSAGTLLKELSFQPGIFPTGRESIQIEYYKDDNRFVEIEVFTDHISVYSEGIHGFIEDDQISVSKACELLEEAYEG